jgi:hypothetical protein
MILCRLGGRLEVQWRGSRLRTLPSYHSGVLVANPFFRQRSHDRRWFIPGPTQDDPTISVFLRRRRRPLRLHLDSWHGGLSDRQAPGPRSASALAGDTNTGAPAGIATGNGPQGSAAPQRTVAVGEPIRRGPGGGNQGRCSEAANRVHELPADSGTGAATTTVEIHVPHPSPGLDLTPGCPSKHDRISEKTVELSATRGYTAERYQPLTWALEGCPCVVVQLGAIATSARPTPGRR